MRNKKTARKHWQQKANENLRLKEMKAVTRNCSHRSYLKL